MYLVIEIRHIILIYNVMGIISRWKNFNYNVLEIDILRTDSQNLFVVLRGDF